MKKRILSLLLFLSMLCSLLPQDILAASEATYSGECGEDVSWSLNINTGLLTIFGSGEMSDFSDYNTVPWRPYRNAITAVTVCDGVTSIGAHAFDWYNKLTSVSIPSSITEIGANAFSSSINLTGIWVDCANTVYSSDDKGILFNKDKTKLIRCPGGFSGSYTIPSGVVYIEKQAFDECRKLSGLIIPDTVVTIGESAFEDCDSLDSVTIPRSVESLGYGVFSGSGIVSITIPGNIKSIPRYAFSGCQQLKNVLIHNGVEKISDHAFYYCKSLNKVSIADSVLVIDEGAFFSCDYIKCMIIKSTNCKIYAWKTTLGNWDDTLIYAFNGSTAHSYAKSYGYPFRCLDNYNGYGNDPNVFWENKYVADIWLNRRIGVDKTGEVRLIDEILSLDSLSTVLYEGLQSNTAFQCGRVGLNASKFMIDTVGFAEDTFTMKRELYEGLILDLVKKTMQESEAVADNVILDAVNAAGTAGEKVTKYKKIIDNIATSIDLPADALLETLKDVKFDPKDSRFTDFYESISNLNDTADMWNNNKFLDGVGEIANAASTIAEFYQRLTAYMLVYELSDEMVALLTEMKKQTTDIALKRALQDVINSVNNIEYIAIINTSKLTEDLMYGVMQECFKAVSKSNIIYSTLQLGYATGTAVSDLLFKTSSTLDAYYLVEATHTFMEANRTAIEVLKQRYLSTRRESDAAAYVNAVQTYYHAYEIDFDSGLTLAKRATEEGLLNRSKIATGTILGFVMGKTYETSYDRLVKDRDSIMQSLATSFDYLAHSWKYDESYLRTDYPDIYPIYITKDFIQPECDPEILSVSVAPTGGTVVNWKVNHSYTDEKTGRVHVLWSSTVVDGIEIAEFAGDIGHIVDVPLSNTIDSTKIYHDDTIGIFPKQYTLRAYTNTTSGKVYTRIDTFELENPCKTSTLSIKNGYSGMQIAIHDPSPISSFESVTYRVYRKTFGNSYAEIMTIDGSAGSTESVDFRDSTAQGGVTYIYKVVSEFAFSNGTTMAAESNEILCTWSTRPQMEILYIKDTLNVRPVRNTRATAGIELSWDPYEGATGYDVYRRASYGTVDSCIGNVDGSTTEFIDTTAIAGVNYVYFVVPFIEEATQKSFALDGSAVGELDLVDENIVINHSLNLANDISINYAVRSALLSDYDSYYLECTIPKFDSRYDMVGTSTVIIDPVLNGNYYYFTLDGLSAVQMGDMIEAQLFLEKDGQICRSPLDTYSISQYAYAQLGKVGISDEFKNVCADLLRYGSAAQKFKDYRTDSLADATMTEEHKSHLTNTDTITFNNYNQILKDIENPAIKWAGKTLSLESRVVVRFVVDASAYTGGVENLCLRVSYTDSTGKYVTTELNNLEAFNPEKNWYAFDFNQLRAAELRTEFSAAVFENDVQVSPTLKYSVDTYCNNKTGMLGDLCKAMIAYSDSAKKFFS